MWVISIAIPPTYYRKNHTIVRFFMFFVLIAILTTTSINSISVVVSSFVVVSSSSPPTPVSALQELISQRQHTTVKGQNVISKTSTKELRSSKQEDFENYNPFTSMVGGIASSLFGGGGAAAKALLSKKPLVDAALSKLSDARSILSWDEIRTRLESVQTDEERMFRTNLHTGIGVASPLHKLRLFDATNSEEDVRVTFYRDSASWCPYCQKVWLTLEEKRIPYRIEKVNMRCYGEKPPSFTRMQPSGQIPVAIIDGTVYGQSNDILYVLDDLKTFPNHKSLQPPKGQERHGQQLLRLERKIFSSWMYWLTGGGQSSKTAFVQDLGEVERELSKAGPFFLGKDVSLVDFMFAPFLERMVASLLYYKGFMIRVPPGTSTEYPAVNRWFDAMETLPSYQLTKSDYYTHCWDLPPQLGGCVSEEGCEPYQKAIDGERSIDGTQGSWELPLQPHNGGIEPDWPWAGDEMTVKREAVERISANHEAIAKFAARGAGQKGMPPVSAPLSDPYATPNEAVVEAVDSVMKVVCQSLLEGVDGQKDVMVGVAKTITEEGEKEFVDAVVASLAYVRDRVGVPRDMKLPAARQLRAHLNWSIGKLLDAQAS